MKIPAQLFQFPRSTLILVCDREHARFFLAHKGRCNESQAMTVRPRKSTERKPLLRTSGHGRILRTGAPTEESALRDEAFRALAARINRAAMTLVKEQAADELYLLAPLPLLRTLRQRLHADLANRLVRAMAGDAVHAHPKAILEKITEERLPRG